MAKPLLYAIDFSWWKHSYVRAFLPEYQIQFISTSQVGSCPSSSTFLVWGMRDVGITFPATSTLLRVEDGFIRSVGLGADLIRPLSWVIDSEGIYYNAQQPSSLEKILQHTEFSAELLQRASILCEKIIEQGLTKYNVGTGSWLPPANQKRVILVPGQVESDASITYGAPIASCPIRRNMELLQAVRQANPEAWIVYKPHPDVLAGLRCAGLNENAALQWCDEQITHVAMSNVLPHVHEVHVLTSLTGFEALLRGKKVVCYGQPFYAGWGVTQDIFPPSRRTRQLTLSELIAGVLILYPRYLSRRSEHLITPELAIHELLFWKENRSLWDKVRTYLLRPFLRLYKR